MSNFTVLTTAEPKASSLTLRQAARRKRSHHKTPSSSSQPHPGPSSILLSDTSVTPWAGLALSESSFTSINLPAPPTTTPPAPKPTPSKADCGIQTEEREVSGSGVNCEVPSSDGGVSQDRAGKLEIVCSQLNCTMTKLKHI